MAILEVGENYKFKTISEAILVANGYDEIHIHSGFYEEVFDCFSLTFVGLPDDENDFSNYPVIHTCEQSAIKVYQPCKFSNIIFSANPKFNEKNLNLLMSKQPLTKQEIETMDVQDSLYQNKFCVHINSDVIFENCCFVGSSEIGVILDFEDGGNRVIFKNCGLFFNSKVALEAYSKKKKSTVVLDNCVISKNSYGMKIGDNVNIEIL